MGYFISSIKTIDNSALCKYLIKFSFKYYQQYNDSIDTKWVKFLLKINTKACINGNRFPTS